MVPGKTYITRFPGDSEPSFVRRRGERPSICDTIGFAIGAVTEPCHKMMSWSRRSWIRDTDYGYYRSSFRRPSKVYFPGPSGRVPRNINQGRLATSTAQQCAACGKHRSPGWCARHPLIPGEPIPATLCSRCRDKHTSSEDSACEKRHHKRRHRHCKHHSSTDEDHCYSRSTHGCSCGHRRYSAGHHHSHRYSRPSSRESVNIVVNNDISAVPIVSEPSSSTTSEEEVHVVRRPRRRSRSRSIVVEVPRAPRSSVRRSRSALRYIRSRSPIRPRRSVTFSARPRHHRRRSSSHVSFVEEAEETPIRSVRPSLRRIFYDGGNSSETEPNQYSGLEDTQVKPEPQFSKTTSAPLPRDKSPPAASPSSFKNRVSQRSHLASVVDAAMEDVVPSRNKTSQPSALHSPSRQQSRDKAQAINASSSRGGKGASSSKKQREEVHPSPSKIYRDIYGESPPFAQTKRKDVQFGAHASGENRKSARSSSITDLNDLANHLADIQVGPRAHASGISVKSFSTQTSSSAIDPGSPWTSGSTPESSFDADVNRCRSPAPSEESFEYEIPHRAPSPIRRNSETMNEYKEYPAVDFSHQRCPPSTQPGEAFLRSPQLKKPLSAASITLDHEGFDYKKPSGEMTQDENEYWIRVGLETFLGRPSR